MSLKCYILLLIYLFSNQNQQNNLTYQLRGNKTANRYEGRKSINVSAPDLELLSFTSYRVKVSKNTDVNLGLMFYMKEDSLLHITAKEIVPNSFYLMKPMQTHWHSGWNSFYPWPTGEVLNPLKIDINGVGIVGRLYRDRPGSGYLVPIILYDKRKPAKINSYTLHVKPKQSLCVIHLQIYKKGSSTPVVNNRLQGTYFAQRHVPIAFDFNGQSDGEYIINLKCRIKNSMNGPNRTYRFYHKSRVE